ncbi:hypothetical protein [Parasitella parasitica]|uniref:Protein-serine/threonine kinase n=1 Tax=Parasitella parasitica TaxID=35722 RepID=A0A0B7MZB6_9FUNG|nr:hypothetical protein [Parasitella parasitica]
MLQSQIINVLPRRILAGLWATQETRISLNHLVPSKSTNEKSQQPAATSSSFIFNELPVRYTHILRLLSTLSPDSLQSPIIRNVAHSYLRDICTLLHPSFRETSPKAISKVFSNLRQSQATNLIRLKYALLSNPTAASVALMENINTIGFGIHLLLDQHLSWDAQSSNYAQKTCPQEVAHQAVSDARKSFANAFGGDRAIPDIDIRRDTMTSRNHKTPIEQEFTFVPSILHRILYESTLLSLKAQTFHDEDIKRNLNWFQRRWRSRSNNPQNRPLSLRIFGGPTSIGFRLDAAAPLLESDLLPGIPRDPLGIPTCGHVLSSTSATTVNSPLMVEWESLSGWRSAKTLASHWGGNLDAVTVEGLGSTIYLALDRDPSLLERYPTRHALAASAHSLLRHHRRTSAVVASADSNLSIQAAATQLDAFLYAISDSQQSTFNPTPLYHHHSVSLSAAVGHA